MNIDWQATWKNLVAEYYSLVIDGNFHIDAIEDEYQPILSSPIPYVGLEGNFSTQDLATILSLVLRINECIGSHNER